MTATPFVQETADSCGNTGWFSMCASEARLKIVVFP